MANRSRFRLPIGLANGNFPLPPSNTCADLASPTLLGLRENADD